MKTGLGKLGLLQSLESKKQTAESENFQLSVSDARRSYLMP